MKFTEFERQGWERSAKYYHSSFTKLTSQVIEPILNELALRENSTLLDIATGTGVLIEKASALGITATGLDFSSEMLSIARHLQPDATFVQGDAESLPFDDESFDAAVMCFGILHLAHPERALREMYRVVKPGGKVAFTSWAPPSKSLAFQIAIEAIEKFGDPSLSLPEGPPFFKYGEERECITALTDAGCVNPRVIALPLNWSLPTPESLFDAFYHGTARTGGLLRAQSKEDLARIETSVTDQARSFMNNGVVEIPMTALLALGHR